MMPQAELDSMLAMPKLAEGPHATLGGAEMANGISVARDSLLRAYAVNFADSKLELRIFSQSEAKRQAGKPAKYALVLQREATCCGYWGGKRSHSVPHYNPDCRGCGTERHDFVDQFLWRETTTDDLTPYLERWLQDRDQDPLAATLLASILSPVVLDFFRLVRKAEEPAVRKAVVSS